MGLFTKAGTWLARSLGLTDPRLLNFVSSMGSDAGERVNVDIAMQLDTVWACVRRISETIATLPLHLYRPDEAGQGIVDSSHPLYFILHDRPNIDMTAVNYWEAAVGCYLLWGNSYSVKSFGANNRITALTPLRPDCTTIRVENDGSRTYCYSFNGKREEFPEEEIFHIKGFSLDGIAGMSPVAQAHHTIGSVRAAERVSGSIFRNGMRPSGYLKAPEYLTDPQRKDAQALVDKFKGSQNTGSVPLLEGGWEFKTLEIPPNDAQMLQTRAFHVEQICRWFDVPPILVGHSGQTTWGSGIEQIMLGWLTLGLRSHLKRIEQAINTQLLSPADQAGRFYAEFNVDGLLRADSAARAQMMASLAQNGLRTRNELRSLDNKPRLDGGDELTVQSNLIPLSKLGTVEHLASPRATQPPDAPADKPATTGANLPGQ